MRARLISAHNPGPWTGAGSNTWLVAGNVPTLVDAGSGEPAHLDEVAHALAEGDPSGPRLAQVLVTHAHVDHAGGAPALAARWPEATFAKYPWPELDHRYPVAWTPLAADERVAAGDAHLHVVHTPGHSPDHVCFFEPHSGTLFAGDLVRNGGTVVIPASHGGSLAQYLNSLRRVLELGPRRILPGHGPAIDQPLVLLEGYIAHRLGRERQIADALGSGPRTVAQIVTFVYPGLEAEMVSAAGENVLAHLRKLVEEGRVRADDEGEPPAVRWRLVGKG